MNREEIEKKISELNKELDRLNLEESRYKQGEEDFLTLLNSGLIIKLFDNKINYIGSNSSGRSSLIFNQDNNTKTIQFRDLDVITHFTNILGFKEKTNAFFSDMVSKYLNCSNYSVSSITLREPTIKFIINYERR